MVRHITPYTNRIIYVILALVSVGIFVAYASTSQSIGEGDYLMPLDDAYIHFQYARQLASGEPYVYNPGDSATSGATSFIYPYVLAIGYRLGFQGLDLGLWAMIVGGIALFGSAVLIYKLAKLNKTPSWMAGGIALPLMINGAVSWHFFSGMETGLIVTFTLWVLYSFSARNDRQFIIAATLLALTRPEGGIMSLIAVGLYGLRNWYQPTASSSAHWWLAVPVAAVGIQPALNLILTGSISAAGSQAKSILGTVPFYTDQIIDRILNNFTRMWREFATGTDGKYVPVALMLLSVFALFNKQRHYSIVLVLIWLVTVSGAISTLDTAFWHFKRYQIPLMILAYPLSVWGTSWLWERIKHQQVRQLLFGGLYFIIVAMSGPTWTEFMRLYEVNLDNIASQPLPMARWLNENTPEDAVIAVHDVGMMRYIGQRYTVDMVGLTTPEAADYWRNGPGSVAEFLLNAEPKPDYIAAYTTARGLNYLVETPLYGELLASFEAEYDPADNVALGADFQGIYRVNWDALADEVGPVQSTLATRMDGDSQTLTTINVANLESEAGYNYEWANRGPDTVFVSEVYTWTTPDCQTEPCTITDGGRRINSEESFTISPDGCSDLLLVTRVHPASAGTFDLYVNDAFVDTQWIPAIPGTWLEIPTFIDESLCAEEMRISIRPNVPDGYYMPYHHWINSIEVPQNIASPLATFQNQSIQITDLKSIVDGNFLLVDIEWQAGENLPTGDHKVFLHIYDDVDAPPIAQRDFYPANATLPPGNWFPGTIEDRIAVQLDAIPAGNYAIALGFYDVNTGTRLTPETTVAGWSVETNGNRLFIDELEIPNNG